MDFESLTELSDRDLLARVENLVRGERRATVALIVHLAEFDNRKLYLDQGCRSLFMYCTRVLHLSEQAAYNRIKAARAARRFPAVLAGLQRGDFHLTAVTMLAPLLTPENHRELLAAAKHKSKNEIDELVVGLKPRPEVPASVRKMPVPKAPQPAGKPIAGEGVSAAPELFGGPVEGRVQEPVGSAAAQTVENPVANNAADIEAQTATQTATQTESAKAGAAASITAVAPERYKVQFTASRAMRDKLRRAQELLRHRIPTGDLAEVFDTALDLLVQDLEKKKFAAMKVQRGERARASASSTPSPTASAAASPTAAPAASATAPQAAGQTAKRSRHIPAAVKRAVWERDQGCCTFVSSNGVRCTERGQLEFDHIRPHGDGGVAAVDNLRLLCRSHNQHAAQQFFGIWQAEFPRPVRQRGGL